MRRITGAAVALLLAAVAGCGSSDEPDEVTVEIPTSSDMTIEDVWESQNDFQREETCAQFNDPDSAARDVWWEQAAGNGLTDMDRAGFDAWVETVCP